MDHLLPAKLARPSPSRRPVHRPRLSERLDEALRVRLVLLSAPPGFGKTTALVDWLAEAPVKAAWLTLDEADNDPARFVRYLWAAIAGVTGANVAPLATLGDDPLAVIDELASLLAESPEPAILVLDDYHVISAPVVQRAVALLLERLPAEAHLVVSTRVDPAFPLARLRSRGELLELRADSLRFTVDEARAFFADRMDLELSDADVDTLVSRTEGWPAVLQLAGLSLMGRRDLSREVRAFAATHRFVLDFITDEVLANLETEDRDFLLRTSILDRLCGELCDALTGHSDGDAILARLERANVLLVPLDDERHWYRYHQLFAELLRARLAVLDPAAPPLIHARASAWFETHGFVTDAVEHALRGGDFVRARQLVAQASSELVHTAQYVTLMGWLDRLPDEMVRSDVLLSTRYGWALVLSGRTDGVDQRLGDAEAALPAALAAQLPDATKMPAHIALIGSCAARLRHDLPTAIALAERGLELAPLAGFAPLVADGRAILGHALQEAGELDRAVEMWRAALPDERLGGNRVAVADIARNLARLEARRGRLQAALEACDEALAQFDAGDEADLPAAAPIHVARAEILERLGDRAQALASADQAAGLARSGGDLVTLREARSVAARAERMPGRANVRTQVEPLSARELEVLRLVAAGRSNREIGAELFISVGTVKTHVHSIVGKLGAPNRVNAIVRAREVGLIETP